MFLKIYRMFFQISDKLAFVSLGPKKKKRLPPTSGIQTEQRSLSYHKTRVITNHKPSNSFISSWEILTIQFSSFFLEGKLNIRKR